MGFQRGENLRASSDPEVTLLNVSYQLKNNFVGFKMFHLLVIHVEYMSKTLYIEYRLYVRFVCQTFENTTVKFYI